MKLREFFSLYRLPASHRRLLAGYLWQKILGRHRTDAQTEANRLLRFVAAATARVVTVNAGAIHLQVPLFGRPLKVAARRYPGSDLGILYQVLGKHEYAPVLDIVKKLKLKSPLRIVDAGANVGYATLFFKSAFPDAQLLALEIDAANMAQVEHHVAANNLTQVQMSQQALWSHTASLRIRRDFRDQSACSFYVEETQDTPDVTGRSLQDFCTQLGWSEVDVLKVDVEGGERFLFATDTLADKILGATRILAIEIHDEFGIRPAMLQHFARNGFTCFNHGDLTIAYRNRAEA